MVVACIYCIYLIDECQRVVIDIGFQEISLKRLETTFFVVVACIYFIYLIDECQGVVIDIGFFQAEDGIRDHA